MDCSWVWALKEEPQVSQEPRHGSGGSAGRFTMEVILEGRRVQALLDSGCGRTLVRKAKGAIMGEQLTLKCIHGDVKTYPTKVIKLSIDGHCYWCRVGIVPNLDIPLLIRRDYPILTQTVEKKGKSKTLGGLTATLGAPNPSC